MSHEPHVKRWRHRFRKPLLAVISTLVALVAAELIMRLTGMAPSVRQIDVSSEDSAFKRSSNAILSYELRPNASRRLSAGVTTTNSHGLRDRERKLEKSPGVLRILFLGDSVVENMNYVADPDTITRQLEDLFGDGTEVLNLAISGYCTLAEVELLKTKGLAFDPDVVVLMFVNNDYQNFNLETRPLYGIVDRPALIKHLFFHSHLFRMASIRLNLYRYGDDQDPVDWNHRATGDNNVVEGLRLLKQMSQEHAFDVVVAIWPTFLPDRIIDKNPMPEGAPLRPDGEKYLPIELLARMNGFRSYRLSDYFKRHLRSLGGQVSPRRYYSAGDGMHPSQQGGRVAATILYNILSAEGSTTAVDLPEDEDPAQFQMAMEAAKALGDKRPNYAWVHYNLGARAARKSDWDGAIEQYKRAVEIDPKFVKAHRQLAGVYLRKGELALAENQYRQALEAEPESAGLHGSLGVLLQSQGNLPEAASHLRRSLKLSPDSPKAAHCLAQVLASTEDPELYDPDEALRWAQAAYRQGLKNYISLNTLAATHAAVGNFKEAVRWQSEAVQIAPQDQRKSLVDNLKRYQSRQPRRR